MIFIYSIKNKIFVEKQIETEYDPLTDKQGVEYVVTQRYMSWIGPISPMRKKVVRAYSISTGQPIPIVIWTPSMKKQADALIKTAKGTWKLFLFPIILLSLIATIAVLRINLKNPSENPQSNMQEIYREEPLPNDIIYARVLSKKSNKVNSIYYTIFKVNRINKDSIFITGSSQKELSKSVYDVKKIINKFNVSDNAFNLPEIAYKLSTFKKAHLLAFVVADADNKPIIEIHYIKRPSLN